ncbi:MAG: SEC-C domain-containing protein [Aestuariivirga sp.]
MELVKAINNWTDKPIFPKAKMGRNEKCWCNSGKKWKHCHQLRKDLPRPNYFEQLNQLSQEFSDGYCSHPSAGASTCSTKIIQAHSIQRKRVLESIAEEGHVLTTALPGHQLFESKGILSSKTELKKIGVRNASTFPGFCSVHDSSLFGPLETGELSIGLQSAYLFSIRALALEIFKKQASIRGLDLQREMLDRGKDFEYQAEVQLMLFSAQKGQYAGIRDLLTHQKKLHEGFPEQIPKTFRGLFIKFDKPLPMVACTSFAAECSFSGEKLADLGDLTTALEPIYLNILNHQEWGIAVFGWHTFENSAADRFIESLLRVPAQKMANALIRLCFEFTENSFFSPAWWRGLIENHKLSLKKRILNGTSLSDHAPNCLVDEGHNYCDSYAVESVVFPHDMEEL